MVQSTRALASNRTTFGQSAGLNPVLVRLDHDRFHEGHHLAPSLVRKLGEHLRELHVEVMYVAHSFVVISLIARLFGDWLPGEGVTVARARRTGGPLARSRWNPPAAAAGG